MSVIFDVQKALYNALIANTKFMTAISDKIYDEPPTDCDYPYCVVGHMTENKNNLLTKLGFENTLTFYIHTKPAGLGWYEATNIYTKMNKVLNVKRFSLDNFNMAGCKLDNVLKEKDGDKRILHVRYRVWTFSDSTHTI